MLASSTNPSLPDQSVTFAVTLNAVAPGAGTPTGTVQFKIDSTNAPSPVALNSGTAGYTATKLTHGLHTVVAEYAGDGNFSANAAFLSPDQLVNTSPVAVSDTLQRDPANGVSVAIATLLTNDWDADGDPITWFSVSATSANGGTVVNDGGWIVYTPPTGFTNADTFNYKVRDSYGAPTTGTVTVNIRDNGPPASLAITNLGNGSYAISGSGVPGRMNRIELLQDMGGTNWQALGTATANGVGVFRFIDANGSAQRFYRVVLPQTGPQPMIQPLRVTKGVATITWTSITGQTYRLQYKDSLGDITWHDLLSEVTATGPTTTVTNFISYSNQRIYRSVYP